MNATRMAEQLRRTDPVIKPACDRGDLEVVAAVYSLQTGKVDFFE